MTKLELLELGKQLLYTWCAANNVKPPYIAEHWHGRCDFDVCAYYRNGTIEIWPNQCASIGVAGRQWSYPGYIVDRTPFGVLQHELGHYVDHQHGAAGGTLSHAWRPLDPKPITSYAPNDNEWFAEMFRLFVTNPDLLCQLRPVACSLFRSQWKSVETRTWLSVLSAAPRQAQAALNRIMKRRG